jgi:hypothetical protein
MFEIPPILFIVFNRPTVTKIVFEAIREAKPKKLYVFADAPRETKSGEIELNNEVKHIATNIDWECELFTNFSQRNLGCRYGPLTAINWFFENETEGIILEDDCLPDQSFFRFAGELLAYYREEEKVMVISGDYFHGNTLQNQYSYYFSNYMHSWGWASWRRAWKKNDPDISLWPSLKSTDFLEKLGNGHKDFVKYWSKTFDKAITEKGGDYWDYQWLFSCWAAGGVTVLPAVNLVKNIGFGYDATHTFMIDKWILEMPLQSISFPLNHPPSIQTNALADRWEDLNVYITKLPFYKRVINKVKRTLNGIS